VSIDEGFLFQNKREIENIKISNYVPDKVPNTIDSLGYSVIYNVEIDADHFRSVTYVRFQKIQEALATMGGIISIMKLFITLILMGINRFSFPFVLFREVYLQGKERIEVDKERSEKGLFNSQLQKMNIQSKNEAEENNKNRFLQNAKYITTSKPRSFVNFKSLRAQKSFNSDKDLNKNEIDCDSKSRSRKTFKLGNEYKGKKGGVEGENAAANNDDIIETNQKFLLEKNKAKFEKRGITQNNSNNNMKIINETTFRNVPSMNCERKIYINKDFSQASNNNNHNRELINVNKINNKSSRSKSKFSSSKNILDNPSSRSKSSNQRQDSKSCNIKEESFENQRDSSDIPILLLKDNKNLQIRNSPENNNPLTIILDRIKKSKTPNEIYLMNEELKKKNIKNTANNENFKLSKKEENETFRSKNKSKFVFYISLPEYLCSICCKRRHISEPLNIILKKMDQEIEIKSYLRLKQDFLLMKNLLFDAKDREIFDNPYDFEEIFYSIKQ